MSLGRLTNKNHTAIEGVGTSAAATSSAKIVMPDKMQVTTAENPQYRGEDDSQTTLTGPGDGDVVGGGEVNPDRWGHVTPSGSRIEINDTAGSERLEMIHHSGAAVVIEPDGSVYLSSKSRRGVGIGAPLGDAYLNAAADVVISGGGSVSIKTAGNLTLDVGGTIFVKCASWIMNTQVVDETIDGSASRSVTNDQSTVVGGINRIAVAGDDRHQVTGNKITDVGGTNTVRVDGDHSHNVSGDSTVLVKGTQKLHSNGKTNVKADDDLAIHTGTDMELASGSQMSLGADGNLNAKSNAQAHFGAAGSVKVTGASATMSADGAAIVTGGSTAKLSAPSASVDGPTVTLGTNTLYAPTPAGTAGPDVAPTLPLGAVVGPTAAEAPKEAEVAEANDIVDNLTSARKFPEYPGNGVTEGAARTSSGRISHDTTSQAEEVYNEYSSGNQGNSNPSQPGGSYETLSEEPVDRPDNIEVIESDIEVPSRHNLNHKISKYFTLGHLTEANHSHTIPNNEWDKVVKEHIKVAVNVLDPIKEKFPDMLVTSAYRRTRPGSNHRSGQAIDFVCNSRSMTTHAEMARYARDNLPVSQVYLERNDTGKTHVHVRVGSGKPKVLTCADPKCHSNTPGIDVEYLIRMK